MVVEKGSNELVNIKCLEECLAHRMCFINELLLCRYIQDFPANGQLIERI